MHLMSRILQGIFIVAVVLATGCAKTEPEATFASAKRFNDLLSAELRSIGAVEFDGPNGGQGGNVFAWTYTYHLSPAEFKPERLSDTCELVLTKWKDSRSYRVNGKGSGRSTFQMHYGTRRTHTFIDAVAFPHGDKTRVDLLLRGIE